MQTGRLKNRRCFRRRGGSLVKSFVYDDTVVETSSLFISPSSVDALEPPSKPSERSCFSELRPRRCSESALDKTSSRRLLGGGGRTLFSFCSFRSFTKTELLVMGGGKREERVFFSSFGCCSLFLQSDTLHYLSAAAVSALGSVSYTINPVLSCE